MQIIILPAGGSGHKQWHLNRTGLGLMLLLLVTLTAAGTRYTINWLNPPAPSEHQRYAAPQIITLPEPTPVYTTTTENESLEGFYAQQLGGLQAEAIRLRMLSQRLAEVAGLDVSDFDLDNVPGLGGVEHDAQLLTSTALEAGIANLNQTFAEQQETLTALQELMLTSDSISEAIPTGRPVQDAYVSSFYGYRVDPFNGRKVFHDGLDFAGKTGSAILSAADGIVSWAGNRGGYGGLVEINHGNGYVTRYAHNKSLKVKTGDRVERGDIIALMGSTGRSTGPHVHYEILKDGKSVNPYNYADLE